MLRLLVLRTQSLTGGALPPASLPLLPLLPLLLTPEENADVLPVLLSLDRDLVHEETPR
jgi:hypothetical protein